MKKLFQAANEYIRRCDWKDLAMIKLCLAAMVVLIGLALPRRGKKRAAWIAGSVFTATYLPLMAKFLRVAADKKE